MKAIKFIFLSLFFICFLACSNQDSEVLLEHQPFSEGEEITLNSVTKTSVTLVRHQNGFKLKNSDKVIMFDIFGTFCTPCQKEAAHLMNYQLQNNDNFMIIALIALEKISDKDIINHFIKPYNAYYFISNETDKNDRLIAQILYDISYKNALSLPFKVVLKDNTYQLLSDNLGERGGQKALYYLGEVSSQTIEQDLKRIK